MNKSPSPDLIAAAEAFRSRHEASDLFVMPCAWDVFSAMLFEQAGFSCIGTTSGGVNWVRGRLDYVYSTPKDDMLRAYGEIASATALPCSGDLENGYGENPEDVADTITQSAAQGMVGGSIEDIEVVPTDDAFSDGKLFAIERAVERISAARAAADATGLSYTLTARCEVYYSLNDDPYREAVERLNAYREAGADCLFVPGLNDISALKQLVADVDGPVSFGMGATPEPISLKMLEDVGVRRVSTGGGLTRSTFGLMRDAVDEMISKGSFSYLDDALSEAEVINVLQRD